MRRRAHKLGRVSGGFIGSRGGPGSQRGLATLMVVMVLFFVAALVSAYASRSLVFEQRTSINSYRATQAFEAAESGMEASLALLNAGRVDTACNGSSDPAFSDGFGRFLTVDPATGRMRQLLDAAGRPRVARCVRGDSSWMCNCPVDAASDLEEPKDGSIAPAFAVSVAADDALPPGTFRVRSVGCTRLDERCLSQAAGQALEGAARVQSLVALASALPNPPAAALTVRGQVTLDAPGAVLVNADPQAGVVVQAGLGVELGATRTQGPAGAQSGIIAANDSTLAGASAEAWFTRWFGVDPLTLSRRGATTTLQCPGVGGCDEVLAQTLARAPRSLIWVRGDLVLDAAATIGSPELPVLLVIDGQLTLTHSSARVHGLVYVRSNDWAADGAGLIEGAVITGGDVHGASIPSIRYDRPVLERLRRTVGQFVRVPGSWSDE